MSVYQNTHYKIGRACLSQYGQKANIVIDTDSSDCRSMPYVHPAEVNVSKPPANLVPGFGKFRNIHEAFQKESRYEEETGLTTSHENPLEIGYGVLLTFVFLLHIPREYLHKH